jgi:hypothetical protein
LDLSIIDNINYNKITENEFQFLTLLSKESNELRDKIINKFIDIDLSFLDFNDSVQVDSFFSEVLKNFSEQEVALFFEKDYENLRAFYKLKDFISNDKIEKIKKHIKNQAILEVIEVSNFDAEESLVAFCNMLKDEDVVKDCGISDLYKIFKYCYSVLGNLIFKRISFLSDKYSYIDQEPLFDYFDIDEKLHFDNLNILKKFHRFVYSFFSHEEEAKGEFEAGSFYYDRELLFLLDREKNRFKLSPYFLNIILCTQKIESNNQLQLFENIFNREMKEKDKTHRDMQSLEELKTSMFIQKKDFDYAEDSDFNKIVEEIKNDKHITKGETSPLTCHYFSMSKEYIDNVNILKSSLSEKAWQFFSEHYIYNDFLLIRSLHSIFRTNNYKVRDLEGLSSKYFIKSLKHWVQSLEENIKLNLKAEEKIENIYPEILFLKDLLVFTNRDFCFEFLNYLFATGVNIRNYIFNYTRKDNDKEFFKYLVINFLPLIQDKCCFEKDKILFKGLEIDFNMEYFKNFYDKSLNNVFNLYSRKEKLSSLFYSDSLFKNSTFNLELFSYYLELNDKYKIKLSPFLNSKYSLLSKKSKEFHFYKKKKGLYFYQDDLFMLAYDIDEENYLKYDVLSLKDFNIILHITGWHKIEVFRKIKKMDYLEYDENGFLTEAFYDLLKLNVNN